MEIFIIRDGEQTGPFRDETVQSMLAQRQIRSSDMAWRKGLPAWLPLSEVLNPGSEHPTEPPPVSGITSGIRSAVQPAPKAPLVTAKQKAFLAFWGVNIPDGLTKADAAVLISDAMEDPKNGSKLTKWATEKLRIHPEAFADELEFKKANRAVHYLEVFQTEGAEVFTEVTKAHSQVLVESLDKRFPDWESNPRRAVWDYLFPALAEHFPALVQPAWKGKLKLGSKNQAPVRNAAPAPAPKSRPTTTGAAASVHVPAPIVVPVSPFQAAVRGVLYGLVVLAAVIGGINYYNHKQAQNTAAPAEPKDKAPAKPEPPKSDLATGAEPTHVPADAPLIAGNPLPPGLPELPPAAEPAAPAPAPTLPENPAPAALPPAATTPMAEPGVPAGLPPGLPAGLPSDLPAATLPPADPTPGLPPAPTTPTATPPAATGPALATIQAPVMGLIKIGASGGIPLKKGQQLPVARVEGNGVWLTLGRQPLWVPLTATNLDPATAAQLVPAPAAGVPAVPTYTPAPTPIPVVRRPAAPSSDL
jgi:hypothetical protein